MNSHKASVLLLISLQLTGCAGVFISSPRTTDLGDVSLSRDRARLAAKKAYTAPPNPQTVRQAWGEPDSITTTGNTERWTYKSPEYTWAGIAPVVLIPLPLMVPTGHKAMLLEFEDGKLVRVLHKNNCVTGGLCGVLITGPCAAPSLTCEGDWHDINTAQGLISRSPAI